jgi:hypothetical protein
LPTNWTWSIAQIIKLLYGNGAGFSEQSSCRSYLDGTFNARLGDFYWSPILPISISNHYSTIYGPIKSPMAAVASTRKLHQWQQYINKNKCTAIKMVSS